MLNDEDLPRSSKAAARGLVCRFTQVIATAMSTEVSDEEWQSVSSDLDEYVNAGIRGQDPGGLQDPAVRAMYLTGELARLAATLLHEREDSPDQWLMNYEIARLCAEQR